MRSNLYYVDVQHEGLHAFRRITGKDRYVVERKAAAQRAAWNAMWEKNQKRELILNKRQSVLRSKEEKRQIAAQRTTEAHASIQCIENTLIDALQTSSVLNWDSLKDYSKFTPPKPEASSTKSISTEPLPSDEKYQPVYCLFDHIFSSLRRRKELKAREAYEADHEIWLQLKTRLDRENETAEHQYQQRLYRWNEEKRKFTAEQERHNASIEARREAYLSLSPDGIVDYCDTVLAVSPYPDSFPRRVDLNYYVDSKLLLVDYSLPYLTACLKEVKYIASRDEFSELFLSDAELEKLYDGLLYAITLRSIYELFQADVIQAIDSIVFNGWVNAVDRATGQMTNGCILSIQVNRQEFQAINLALIEPKACFKRLKGIGSSKLAALVPVRPILQLDTKDDRFVPSHNVAERLDDSVNIAAMDWEEFEHLIREVFEKEFQKDGSEVKITRASRDHGVDAVVFDPDALRGGKIVIQAKRYTNTVDVSAVRDLYGTVLNEGANKGILVTTADYGPDAYAFAKDKPLTLLNGSNLLHLLEKHGHRAKIDLREAKLILKAAER